MKVIEWLRLPETRQAEELGSGGGFIKEIISNVIASDILEPANMDKVFSAVRMRFEETSVDAFFIFDGLYYITDPRAFFTEALRRPEIGGKVVTIEPANTLWSRFIYKNFHHEHFDPQAQWDLEEAWPLSRGRVAIPWITSCRDRVIFESEFASLRIVRMRNHTPLRYLLRGGLTLRQLVPSFTYPLIKAIEYALSPINNRLGMFQTMELKKVDFQRIA
jgi:SAM-dependent methyltransferase